MIGINRSMPKTCEECTCNDDGYRCGASGNRFDDYDTYYREGRMPDCPLIDLQKYKVNQNAAEYIIPKTCEVCGSDNIAVRVIFDKGITRYICLNCNNSRSIAKQENLKKRSNTPINNWAQRVVKRHPFCTICGNKEELEAHHIIPVSHARDFMLMDTNGITLCKRCHLLVHNHNRSIN